MLFGIRCSRSAYVATSQGLSIRLLPRWTRWAGGWGQGAGCRKAEEAALLGQHFWEVTATRVCYKIFVFLFCLVFLVYVSETLQGEKGLNISFSHIKRFVPRNLKNSWKSLKRSLVHP